MTSLDFINLAPAINSLLLIALSIGTFLAFRNGTAKTSIEAQKRTIDALQIELTILKDRIERLARENEKLLQRGNTIRTALAKRGIQILIEDDLITISDDKGGMVQTIPLAHIQGSQGTP
jgi:cell division protein FtsB